MHFTIKFLILIVVSITLSGCAGLYNCSRITDNPAAFQECQAKNGNSNAQYELGLAAYEIGNIETAIKWLKKAASPDTALSHIYMPPVGGQKYGSVLSLPKSNPYPGHKEAQLLLSKIYAEGDGVERDYKKAERYFKMATTSRGNR